MDLDVLWMGYYGILEVIPLADFHRLCSEVYPTMVCLITKYLHNLFWVGVLHYLQEWQTFKIRVTSPCYSCYLDDWGEDPRDACEDEGSVCFVTRWNLG